METNNAQDTQGNAFAAEAAGKRKGLAREFLDFLKHNKKWWLAPLLMVILLLGALIVTAGGVGPFIYALF